MLHYCTMCGITFKCPFTRCKCLVMGVDGKGRKQYICVFCYHRDYLPALVHNHDEWLEFLSDEEDEPLDHGQTLGYYSDSSKHTF